MCHQAEQCMLVAMFVSCAAMGRTYNNVDNDIDKCFMTI